MGMVLRITLWWGGGEGKGGQEKNSKETKWGWKGGMSWTHAEDDGAQLLLGQNVGHLLQKEEGETWRKRKKDTSVIKAKTGFW